MRIWVFFLPRVLFLSEHSLSIPRNCSSYTTSLKNLHRSKTQHLLHLTKGCHWIQSRQQLYFLQDQLAPGDTSWTSKIFFKIVLWTCFIPADILRMERHYTNIQPGVISFDHLDNGRPNPDCRQTLVWRICRLNPSTLSGLGTYVSLSPIVSNIYTTLDEPAFSPNWRLPISRERRVHGILLIFFWLAWHWISKSEGHSSTLRSREMFDFVFRILESSVGCQNKSKIHNNLFISLWLVHDLYLYML